MPQSRGHQSHKGIRCSEVLVVFWLGMLVLVSAAQGQNPPSSGVASITGRVVDARSGEGIAKALVSVRQQALETVTGEQGKFTLSQVTPGEVELYVSTVGYELLKQKVQLSPGQDLQLEIQLGRPLSRRHEEVTVTADPFEPGQASVVSEQRLSNTEMNSLSSVMVDDPLRSVQTLPGVTTSDDSNAQFALRGIGFNNVGVYVDGVLLSSPFHTVDDLYQPASLTLLNSGMIDSIELLSGGFPASYGERDGAILDIRTRAGNKDKVLTHAMLGMTGLAFSSEGPVGHTGRATWLVSGRKSYLGYLLDKIDWNNLVMGYQDVNGKLTYQLTPRHQFVLNTLYGSSWFEPGRDTAENNHIKRANKSTGVFSAAWNWIPGKSTLLNTQMAYVEGAGKHHDQYGGIPFTSETHEFSAQQEFSAQLGTKHSWQSGWTARRAQEDLFSHYTDVLYPEFRVQTTYDRSAWHASAYTQDSWRPSSRLTLNFGGRFEHFSPTEQDLFLPRASVAWLASSRDKLTFAWGRYGQFPGFRQLWGEVSNPGLRAERTTQYVAAIEHRLTDKLRIRVEGYDSELREGIYSAAQDWRLPRLFDLASGLVPIRGALLPRLGPNLQNYVHGYSRGVEFQLQRRSANRLSGWISYSLGYTRQHDPEEQLSFVSDYDQRNTINAFGSYRVSQTINLSAKYRYGSNFPIPGFYRILPNGNFDISDQRNQARLPAYSRLDLRMDKAFYLQKRKLTLFAEVLNTLNRKNRGCRPLTLLEFAPSCQDGFPVLPSAGLSVDF